jgi:hypothetical protein
MSWFKVDDGLPEHPKVEKQLEPDYRDHQRAMAAWVILGAACARRGNGGAVSRELLGKVLGTWPARERTLAAEALVRAGLWDLASDGWSFHDWIDYQPSEAEERDVRAKRNAKQQRWREKRRLRSTGDDPHVDGLHGSTERSTVDPSESSRARAGAPVPSRPDPSPPLPSKTSGVVADQVARAPEPGPATTLSRDAETIRKAVADAFEAANIRPAPMAVRDIDGKPWVALVEPLREVARVEAEPLARIASRLATGFLASPRAKKASWPIPWLVANPREYLAPRAGVSDFSHVKPEDNQPWEDET